MTKTPFPTVCALALLLAGGCATMPIKGVQETGTDYLVGTQEQAPGYGLYSYVLFVSPPTEQNQERYLKTIRTFLDWPKAGEAEPYFKPARLNLTALPVKDMPPEQTTAEEVLAIYNYPRAQAMLKCLPEQTWQASGPFLVSVCQPLRVGDIYEEHYLFQDLSRVPPDLIRLWMDDFKKQVAKPRFWETDALRETAKALRTAVAIAAQGLPDVLAGLQAWIKVAQKGE
ncbi:hypothetical protein JW933_01955 [candidate division FCPU426 bacterium]|nr:hypothetical protein [candidate division FCPU426 bacterium]